MSAPFFAMIIPLSMPGGPVGPGGPSGPVDPGYSPPWAQVRPPVDPGYSPPWAQVPDKPPLPPGPVDPDYSPPWAQVPDDTGNWVWGYSPQQKRWIWVRVPGEGEVPGLVGRKTNSVIFCCVRFTVTLARSGRPSLEKNSSDSSSDSMIPSN